MKVRQVRNEYLDKCIISKCSLYDNDGTKIMDFFTCENPKEGSEKGMDLAIPKGEYLCKRFTDSFTPKIQKLFSEDDGVKVKGTWRLGNEQVPYDRGIDVHVGNTEKDTLGCILPGYSKNEIGVLKSKDATKDLYNLTKDEDELTWIIE